MWLWMKEGPLEAILISYKHDFALDRFVADFVMTLCVCMCETHLLIWARSLPVEDPWPTYCNWNMWMFIWFLYLLCYIDMYLYIDIPLYLQTSMNFRSFRFIMFFFFCIKTKHTAFELPVSLIFGLLLCKCAIRVLMIFFILTDLSISEHSFTTFNPSRKRGRHRVGVDLFHVPHQLGEAARFVTNFVRKF